MGIKSQIDISELSSFENRISDAGDNAERHVIDMLNIIGWQMHGDAVEMIIRGPKRSGNKYKRGGMLAQRSARGEPAKQDTGNLQSSLDVVLSGSKSVTLGYLQSIAPYGEDLEDPTKLNRPVLVPVKTQNITFIRAQIKRTVNNMIEL